MKKLILALIMALPCISIAQISTQKISNTGVIYDANSALRVNGSTVLSNETVNGSMAVNGVSTLNSNLTVNGITTINSNLVVTGSQTFNGDETVNGSLLVTNSLTANGVSTFKNTTTVTNGNFSMWNGVAQLGVYSTNTSLVSGGNGQARIEFYTPAFFSGTVFGLAGSTNSILTGSIPGDMVMRTEATARILWGEGTTVRMFGSPLGGGYSFVFGAATRLIASNDFTVAGIATMNGATIVSNTFVATTSISTPLYKVGAVNGFSGVVTNQGVGTSTNILFFGVGILTNLTRIP